MSANLPEQVRKQSEEIQALYRDMKMGTDGEAAEAELEDPSPEAVVEDIAPAAEKERKAEKPSKKKESEDFKQKYQTLQGMYNTDVPKLRQQNADLEQRLRNMEELLAGMGSGESTQSTSLEVKSGSIVTEDDISEYGDSIEVMRRVSQEELRPLIAKLGSIESALNNLNREVVPKVNRVYTTQAQTAEQQFWGKINAEIPNWKSINNNDDFITWLYAADPVSGKVRQDLLDDAQHKGDAARVIHIFKAWMGETGYDDDSETDIAHANSSSELEAQVAPGRGRSSSPKGKGEKPVFSRLQIQTFYNDIAKGKFKGRDADRKKIEADIFEAQRDGRVVD